MKMGIARIYELLEKEYKTMLLALTFIFPMSYADCWKLSASFPNLDFMPQVILSVAVAVILMFGGFVLDVIYNICMIPGKLKLNINFPVLIMPTVISTTSVILSLITSILFFCIVFGGFILVSLLLFVFLKPDKKILEEITDERSHTEYEDKEPDSTIDFNVDK